MPTRFVILHHTGHGDEHWDLMIEHGDSLLTWQLLEEPTDPISHPIPARRLGDHRKAYLGYEGPVSGGRGNVRRIDSGPAQIEQLTGESCRFRAEGRMLAGQFILQQAASGWTLSPSQDA